MPKPRSTPNRPRDVSQLAKRIVDISTGEATDDAPASVDPRRAKRGTARAAKLTPEERSRIAKQAAAARWTDKR
jgi:hypothetical protein